MFGPFYARSLAFAICVALATLSPHAARAHVDGHPSVHDTVSAIRTRMTTGMPLETLRILTRPELVNFLTDEERSVLGSEHLSFTLAEAATVYVMHDVGLGDDPFWLTARDFAKTDMSVMIDGDPFDVWSKEFDAGFVGLGVNSLQGGYEHYAVAVTAKAIALTDVYPSYHDLATAEVGERPYTDRDNEIESLPEALVGATLVRTSRDDRNNGQLLNVFTFTDYPATSAPDQVVLTWSDDPKTTVTVQWRTSTEVTYGVVSYTTRRGYNSFTPTGPASVRAETVLLETPETVNDPVSNRHTAVLRGLTPDTAYVYAVGDGTSAGTTELVEFTTAPEGNAPFSFVYMGDAQNGLDRWGTLVHNAFRERPD
ncbi:MAG: fibronectin type III domain-containing protein, partial [Candidatus Poribacteria bacterium]